MERKNTHPFGSKKRPENFEKETEMLEVEASNAQDTLALSDILIQNYFTFIQRTLRPGKFGDINYAIHGMIGELAELTNEMVFKQLGANNQKEIVAEAGDVLWYTMLLINTQYRTFQHIKVPYEGTNSAHTVIQQILHWIDKICKYGTQHNFNSLTNTWEPRAECIDIRGYIEEILEFLLRYSDLTLPQLMKENMKKLDQLN